MFLSSAYPSGILLFNAPTVADHGALTIDVATTVLCAALRRTLFAMQQRVPWRPMFVPASSPNRLEHVLPADGQLSAFGIS
jgi:hypothetical protein